MSNPNTLTFTTPTDLAVACEWTLGFKPVESVVVMGLGGGAPTARIDLPRTPDERGGATVALSDAYTKHPGTVAVIVFTADEVTGAAAAEAVTDAIAGACYVPLLLLVNGETITDLLTGQSMPLDPERRDAIAAEFIAMGRPHPRAARQDLADTLATGETLPLDVIAQAIQSATDSPETHRWLLDRFDQFRVDGLPLDDQDAARMLSEVAHCRANSDAIYNALERRDPAQVAFLTDLARRAPAMVRTEVSVLLGFACWLVGDGAGAWVALDHAEAPSDHIMAYGLSVILEKAIHPDAWERLRPANL